MKATDSRWGYAWAVAAVLVCTAAGLAMQPRFDLVNIAMVYLLAVVVISMRFTRGAAIATAVLAVAVFDILFVPPHGRLTVDDAQYLLTFAIMIAVALVITGLARRAREEAQAQARLGAEAELERIRSMLLASISHDLRTPLAVMTGASSTLAEKGDRLPPHERQALAQSVFQQASELSDHVAKVLEMTRLETGALQLDRDWASISEIAGSSLRRHEARLAAHRLMVEVPTDLPLVRVDAALVEQALGNLLDNAGRHTPPGTVVRLRAYGEGEQIVVCVEDYGGGIAEEDAERLFAKFHRATPEGGTGIGLGLAIVRAVVRLHGGRAWAQRVPEGGTAFHFTLPVEPAPPAPSEA